MARGNFNLATACGSAAAFLMRPLAWPFGKRRGARMLAQISADIAPLYRLETPLGQLEFRCPSAESVKAAARFAYDEPETRWWIETVVQPGECVWDIGANVGLYALYAALRVGQAGRVICFEPGANNYAALNANIQINDLTGSVDAYCVALADKTMAAQFALADAAAGRAGHCFQANGEAVAGPHVAGYIPATQSSIGFSIDDFLRTFRVRAPDHIKLDVDSIEEQILLGGGETLMQVKSVLIENNVGGAFAERDRRLHDLLVAWGFAHNEEIARKYPDRRNRVFIRP